MEELFENAANDANVIESRKWVEAAYPRDDLEKYPGYQVTTFVSLSQQQIFIALLRHEEKHSNVPKFDGPDLKCSSEKLLKLSVGVCK